MLKIFTFGHCVLNFIEVGWFFVEIWRFDDFQDGGCPPFWILVIVLWESPCRTFYGSSIETIALDCRVFEKIAFLYSFWRQKNGRRDRQTNRWTAPWRKAVVAVESGELTSRPICLTPPLLLCSACDRRICSWTSPMSLMTLVSLVSFVLLI